MSEKKVSSKTLEELLRNRPTHEWMFRNLDKIEIVEKWFLEFEKEFVILTSGKYTFKFRKGEDSTDFDESFEPLGKSVEVSGTELDK